MRKKKKNLKYTRWTATPSHSSACCHIAYSMPFLFPQIIATWVIMSSTYIETECADRTITVMSLHPRDPVSVTANLIYSAAAPAVAFYLDIRNSAMNAAHAFDDERWSMD